MPKYIGPNNARLHTQEKCEHAVKSQIPYLYLLGYRCNKGSLLSYFYSNSQIVFVADAPRRLYYRKTDSGAIIKLK